MRTRTLFFALAFSFLPAGLFAQSAPLDHAEILGRLALDYSPSYIAHLVKTRGVSFSSSENFIYRVKLAGGDGILAERLLSTDTFGQSHSLSDPVPSDDHLAKCAELIHTGDIEPAEKECRAAIEENPKSPWPLLVTAQQLKFMVHRNSLGRPFPEFAKEAEGKRADLLRRAAALSPNLSSVHRELTSILPPVDARSELQKAYTLDAERLENGQQANGENGGFGVNPYRFSLGSQKDSSVPVASSNQPITIDPELLRTIKIEPDLASNHVALAVKYSEVGNFDRAENELQEAIRLEPDNPALHGGVAYFYLSRHNVDACLAQLQETIRIAPFAVFPRTDLAGALESLGRTPEAVTEFKNLLAIYPAAIRPSNALIELYLEHKDRKSAIEELRRSLHASSVSFADQSGFMDARFDDLYRLAFLLKENGELDAAAGQYLDLLRHGPDSAGLHNDYGNVLLDQRRLDEAISEYNEAIRLDPQMATPHHNIGVCLSLKKDIDGAIAQYRRALELNPNEPRTQVYLGAVLGLKGDRNAAMEQFRQATEKNPEDPNVHISLGFALEQIKDTPGAIKELKIALTLEPDSSEAQNNLAWLYVTAADRGLRNPAEALVLARRAVDSTQRANPSFLDTLAEALLLNGQPAEALATEEEALKLAPRNAELQSRLPHFQEAVKRPVSAKH